MKRWLGVIGCFVGTIVLYQIGMAMAGEVGSRMEAVPLGIFSDITYDAGSRVLSLTFTNGYAYTYIGVPEGCYRQLLRSRHKGSYYNDRIRGRFSYRREVSSEVEVVRVE